MLMHNEIKAERGGSKAGNLALSPISVEPSRSQELLTEDQSKIILSGPTGLKSMVGNKMNAIGKSATLWLFLACMAANAGDAYFGGVGDSNAHWVGYLVSVDKNSFAWTASTLDPARRGRIKVAPATFTAVGSNSWTAVFDEYFRRGNGQGYGLSHHELQIKMSEDRESIQIHDGKRGFDLLRMSPEDLKVIKSGRIPNHPAAGKAGTTPRLTSGHH